MKLRSLATIFTLLCFSASQPIFAQAVNGSLLGTITDSSGAAIPNAKVIVTETKTGVARNANTNESGNYTFADLPPGNYAVAAEITGFKRTTRPNIDIAINSSPRVDLVLQPGNVSESIEVTGAPPILQTERADTGINISQSVIENIPLGGSHNFQSLSILVPGAAVPESQHSAFFNPQVSLATRFNGVSRLGNNLELEGIDDNERTGLLQVLIPPQEAIQAVDISTSNFEASIGRATGGAINVMLKSGDNQFHGSLYETNKVSALAARNWYDPARGHYTYNYFGGTFGGRIIKNRTFFFGDYLRIEDHSANNDRLTVPTADMRAGNLNVAASGAPTIIYDPNTGNANTAAGRTPFPGNIIPASRINPVSAKILSIVPLPNLSGLANPYSQNLFSNLPFFRTTDQFDVKVDHNQTDKDRFAVRLSFSRPVTSDASIYGIYGGPRGVGGSGFEGTGIQTTYSGAINYNHIFSPSLIAEARFGVNRYRNDAQQFGYGQNTADALGIPGINGIPWTSGPPQINLNNFGDPFIGFSASLPWVRAETNILFVNTWTKTKGNHTIKWGVDLRRVRDDLLQTQTYNPRGRYSFGTSQTSIAGSTTSFTNSLASFLLDAPADFGRDYPVAFPTYRAWQIFSFVQDKWLVTPKLTVDIGIRWEYYPPAKPSHTGGFSQYDPSNNSLRIAGVGSVPSDLGLNKNYRNFAPRIGLAYRMNEKTVIRTGFGISYSPFPDNTYAYNFPIKQNNFFTGNCSLCVAVLPNGQNATFQAGAPPFASAVIPASGIINNADINQSYIQINPNFKEPYVASWNFAIQRALPMGLSLDVAYVGNHGVDQPAQYNLNASTTLGADVAGQPLYQKFGKKSAATLYFVGYSSRYNGLQVKLNKRMSGGLAVTTSYSWGRAMGYQSEDSGLNFYINPKRNWQRLNFDRAQTFVQSYIYELPFGKGKKMFQSGPGAAILGGWQVNGLLSIDAGAPLNFGFSGSSLKAPGNSNTLNYFGGNIQVTKGNGRSATWFNATKCVFGGANPITTNCFAQPGASNGGQPEFGNLGLNSLTGPGFWNLDASVFRTFEIRERFKLQIKAESFSVVNTPRWNNPNTDITSSNFGYITGAGGARYFQLAAKLSF